MQRENWTWTSSQLTVPVHVARWGHFGTPILLFPTAGGDREEVERFHLVASLAGLIDAGRIKVFSIDGLAARTWLRGTHSPEHCARVQSAYDAYVYQEVVPLIRRDCQSDSIEVIAAGAAIGAYNAVASICAHPDVFRLAVGMSGIFDLSTYLPGGFTPALYATLPVRYLPTLDEGPRLQTLRGRNVLLASGDGDYECPAETRNMASVLESRGIPNKVDWWGPEHPHSWSTWREMLPRYLTAHA